MMDRDSVACFLCASLDICAHRETELIRWYQTRYPTMRLLSRPARSGFEPATVWPWMRLRRWPLKRERAVIDLPARPIEPAEKRTGFRLGVTREDAYRLRRG